MGKVTEYRLGKAEQRAVIALGREQTRLMQEQREVQEALSDLATRFAADFGFDADDGAFHFDQKGDSICLIVELAETEGETDQESPG